VPEPIADHGGRRTPYGPPGGVERLAAALPGRLRDALPAEIGLGSPWPVRVDTFLDEGVTEADVDVWVQNVSATHSSGDALDIAVKDGRIVGVRGRAADRVNHGRIDPRDRHGPPAAGDGTRLTRPMIRVDGRLVECDWDTAMGRIADRSKELLDAPGGWGRLGFYTGGRLLLEEHYTLAVIAKAGIATPHVDGGTRVGDATAAAALTASFGADGQPGSYTDVDHCDAIALWGQDMAESRVVWERMLDRRLGPRPPTMIAVDPQETQVAKEADVHLPIRSGTNVALMNALLHELIAGNRYDAAYVARHTIGFAELCRVVEAYPPKRAAEICAVPAALIEQAAEFLGSCERLVSTVLPGFYRSNQATVAACQVNNLHLLRGMLGRPGAGVFQMTGRPAGQHARETGTSGDLPGMRNWENADHVRELAELWNVDLAAIPHWGPPTHAMQIFRYAEQGSIRLLWISAADPVVSLPHAGRVRRVLESEELFLVAQDLYLTETARLADVVLPAAGWGEKTGTVTGADRTVHLCERAVEPPGEARADLDIFFDYARRMDFRDRDGAPHRLARRGVGVRGVEGLLERAPVRLHRHHLRPAARGRRHPVAVHPVDGVRRRAPVRGRAVRHRPRRLPELRARSRDGSGMGRGALLREGAPRARVPPRRGLRALVRGDRRRAPAVLGPGVQTADIQRGDGADDARRRPGRRDRRSGRRC
jgi:ferredoxin-nitrate reductase